MHSKKLQKQKPLNPGLWFLGTLTIIMFYVFTLNEKNNVNFIFLLIAGALMFYWIPVISKMLNKSIMQKEQPTTNIKEWIYDLIPIDNGFLFVADVPEPEDKIIVRLNDNNLILSASGGFDKKVNIPNSEMMKITSFKYRNGVLTLQITYEQDT